ncbi:MAG: hypothetical protein NC092_02015 [Butyrivibrio sp.]|nr:hypothetical protein [Butyrivibrio sp.]
MGRNGANEGNTGSESTQKKPKFETVNLEKDEKVSSGVFDKVEVWRGNVSGEFHVSSGKTQKMAKSHQKTVHKAERARNKTQKTVYHLEKVYDKSKGRYTFQTVAHKVDKDFMSKRKKRVKNTLNTASKGKAAIQKGWNTANQIMREEVAKDDGYLKGEEAVVSAARTFNTAKKGVQAFNAHNLNKRKKKAQRLQNRADFKGFQLEGRKGFEKEFANKVKEGKIAENKAHRAVQKALIKKKYQSQAILKYAQHKSSATAFLTSSAARKKMLEAAARTVKKYLLIGGGVVILMAALLGGCVAVFSGIFGGSEAMSVGVYLADHEELDQVENYFNKLEMLLVEAICNFEQDAYAQYAQDCGAVNGTWTADDKEYRLVIEYDLDAIRHNPTTLVNYLTVMFDNFKIDMKDLNSDQVAQEIINPLFYSCYGVVPLPATDGGWFADDTVNGFDYAAIRSITESFTSGPYTYYTPTGTYDEGGREIMDEHEYYKYHLKVGGSSHAFRSLDDVVQERIEGMDDTTQSRYGIISETNGALQQAKNILGEGINIQERIVDYYGNYLTNTNYSYDGWSPLLVRPPEGQSRQQASRDYVSIWCDSSGSAIYAGMAGTVTDVSGGTVTIKISSGKFIFEGLDSVSVARNQTVSVDTVIGSCSSKLYVYYQEGIFSTSRNPLFYIK